MYFSQGKPKHTQLTVMFVCTSPVDEDALEDSCWSNVDVLHSGCPKAGVGREKWTSWEASQSCCNEVWCICTSLIITDLFCLCHESSPIGNWNQNVGQELDSKIILKNTEQTNGRLWKHTICTCVRSCAIILRQFF